LSKGISPDTIIGHYRVVSKIGEGGMGEVYLAEDSRLHRKAALVHNRCTEDKRTAQSRP
jgi:serine/threonine-protein kinase